MSKQTVEVIFQKKGEPDKKGIVSLDVDTVTGLGSEVRIRFEPEVEQDCREPYAMIAAQYFNSLI